MLENFSEIEKEIFLTKFMFFAIGNLREQREQLMPGIQYARKTRTVEEPQQIIQRKFPEMPDMSLRYIMPARPQVIGNIIASEANPQEELLGKKMVFDVSEKVPVTIPNVKDRRLTISMEEINVPVPKKLEGKKPQLAIKIGQKETPQQMPMQTVDTSLDKLNPFLDDSRISSIECVPNEAVKITRDGDKMATQLILDEADVKKIIQEFSDRTRIPLSEFFKAAYRDWQINAISSEVIGSRFILNRDIEFKKLEKEPAFQFPKQEEKVEEKIVFKPLQPEKVNEKEVYSSITEDVPKPSLY